MTKLLDEKETDSTETGLLELVSTQDVSIQCGKVTWMYNKTAYY